MRIAALLIGCCVALHFPAGAEQIKATYVEIAQTYSYEQLTRTRTKPTTLRIWRGGDLHRGELGFVSRLSLPREAQADAGSYACSLPLVIDTPEQLLVINQINRKGIRVPKTNELKKITDALVPIFSCFGLCPLGEEPEWFKDNGKRMNNDPYPAYMFRRENEEWTLQTDGYSDSNPKTVEYKTGSESVRWDYLVVGRDIPIGAGLFQPPDDIEWLEIPTPADLGMVYKAIGASPRPEYFLNAGHVVITDDFNFDGYRDFAIFIGASAKAPYYDYFVYRPANDTFSLQPELSLTANARFDTKRKAVYTFHPGGAASRIFSSDKYVWQDSEFFHVSRIQQTDVDNYTSWVRRYYRIVNGEPVLIKETTIPPPSEMTDYIACHEEL